MFFSFVCFKTNRLRIHRAYRIDMVRRFDIPGKLQSRSTVTRYVHLLFDAFLISSFVVAFAVLLCIKLQVPTGRWQCSFGRVSETVESRGAR